MAFYIHLNQYSNQNILTFYYNPVLQSSFRQSISGSLQTIIQMLQAKKVINCIYVNVNGKMPEDSASQFNLAELPQINSIPASRNFQKITPNATQHKIPAWTIFAMFFIVISSSECLYPAYE